MLNIEDLRFRYDKKSPWVLEGVDLTLNDGEIGVVLGPNGAGKTTLFQTILGILKYKKGRISYDGKDLKKLRSKERARLVAWVPQDLQFGAMRVFDAVLMGRLSYFNLRPSHHDGEVVAEVLQEMGLWDFAERDVSLLSGGERQKVAIARALAQEPKLLIFDEPGASLDVANVRLLWAEARRASRERGISILTSTHDLNEALRLGDRFFFLKDGKILLQGGREIVTKELLEEVFEVGIRTVESDGETYYFYEGE